jgi:hypothetical protein
LESLAGAASLLALAEGSLVFGAEAVSLGGAAAAVAAEAVAEVSQISAAVLDRRLGV